MAQVTQQVGGRTRTVSPDLLLTVLPQPRSILPLTQSVKGGHQANVHPVLKVCGCQSELKGSGRVLFKKLKAQPRDWLLPPGLQQRPHLLEDRCPQSPLVLVGLEAVEENDKFSITATPESCAPARGASLIRKKQTSESCTLQP